MSTTNWPIEFTRNPLNIQQAILNRFEEYSNGDFIADPNNVVSFTIEMFSEMAASASNEIDSSVMSAMYPARAQSTNDLYKHMSDWDYVNIFSSPASATIQLSLDKTYLIANAIEVYKTEQNGSKTLLPYKKIVIPKSTLITIGSYTFGLYYPIEIRINTVSGAFSVIHDTTESNPLHTIQSNVLEHSFRQYENLKLLYIQIPVYQFKVERYTDELIAGTGYKKTFSYDDLFYAIRCTADVFDKETNTWKNKELSLAMSNQSYDQTTPTVVFTVLPESKTCEIYIPYVYFSDELIKGTLSVEIYTTAGKLNYTIPTNTTEICSLSFFTDYITAEEAIYAEPLRTIPAIAAIPLNTVVSGGSNGMSYDDLRYKVITDTFSDKPLQTPDDVDAYFKNKKYVTTKFRDGITDRIFISHKALVDDKNATIGAASIKTKMNLADISRINTIHKSTYDANVYTILPSTIYRFDKDSGTCIPLTQNEILALDSMSLSDKVDAYNTNNYTISPFHLQMSVDPTYPTTITYDLMDTEIVSREFIGENSRTASQLTVYTTRFKHANDGVGGYDLDILVSRTDDLKDFSAEVDDVVNFRVIVAATSIYKKQSFAIAEFIGRTSDIDQFLLKFNTNYDLYQVDGVHAIGITNTFTDSDGDYTHPLSLNSEIRIILCAKKSVVSSSGSNIDRIISGGTEFPTTIGTTDMSDFVALSEQKIVLKLGSVVNELDQRMSLSYSQAEYKTYNTTKFLTINQPIYDRDDNGAIVYTNTDGVISLSVKYPAGSLTMMTEKTEEIIILSQSNINRYIGCKFTLVDGSLPTVILTAENSSAYYGRQGVVVVQRTPKFIVSGAYSDSSSDSPVVGSYNISDPLAMKALSSSTDEWVMNKWVPLVTSQFGGEYNTYKIRVVDSLLVALKLAPVVANHSILTKMTTLDGCFVFVTDDNVGTVAEPRYIDAEYHNITSDSEATTECTARLYYRHEGVWRCLVGARVLDALDPKHDLVNAIKTLNAGYSESRDTIILQDKNYYTYDTEHNVFSRYFASVGSTPPDGLYEKKPSFQGYAYIVEQSVEATNAANTTVDPVYGLGTLMYVSFLNTDSDGCVDFTNVPTVKVNTDGSYESTDVTWTDTINKWPWDSLSWLRVKSVSLSYTPEGSTSAISINGGNRLIYDDLFVAAYDPQGTTKFCEYVTGQLILDENGKPKEDSTNTRDVVYLINMLQMDAKLKMASTSAYASYPENVRKQMRTYFDELGEAKPKLYTNSRLFFEPLKSFGYGTFVVGDGEKELPLDISMSFKLYVSKSASEDTTLVDSLKDSIISIVDESIDSNVVNCSAIAKRIIEELSDSVQYVDVLGINGDPTLQTMTCVDTNVRPHLKHTLELLDDGTTVDVNRGLNIELVVVE